MIDIPVLGRNRAVRATVRDARDASSELRQAAHEMRRAMERFPRDRSGIPGASAALADAARTMRDASRAAREAAGRGPEASAVAEAIRTELDMAAGAAADAARDAAFLGVRTLGPVAADVARSAAGLRRSAGGAGRAASKELRSAGKELRAATEQAAKDAGKEAAKAGKEASKQAARELAMAKDLRGSMERVRGNVTGMAKSIDIGAVTDAALPLAAALGRPRRRGMGLARGLVLIVVPFLLAAPLVAIWQRRQHDAAMERLRTTGATGALGIGDPAVADDLLRSESEGYSTGVAAPSAGATWSVPDATETGETPTSSLGGGISERDDEGRPL